MVFVPIPLEKMVYLKAIQKFTTRIRKNLENRGEQLGDQVMKTPSHRSYTLQVTLIEFEQLLQGRKWELVFTLQSHFVDFSHNH